jgi:hypothetical protein
MLLNIWVLISLLLYKASVATDAKLHILPGMPARLFIRYNYNFLHYLIRYSNLNQMLGNPLGDHMVAVNAPQLDGLLVYQEF